MINADLRQRIDAFGMAITYKPGARKPWVLTCNS